LGLVHRDVSPSNILVSYDGDVKLVDFGIAKATAHSHATQTAAIKGKIAYMAPEQLRGESLDRRSDIFAMCVVLYEMVLGKRCFSAPGEFALINKVAAARFSRPSKVDPSIESELETLVVEGLSASPDARPRSARELQLRLEEVAKAHDIRLSKVALAEFMEATFGLVDFPRTDCLPLPAGEAPEPAVVAEPAPVSRTIWPWILVALGVGVTGGVIAVRMASETPSAPAAVVVPEPSQPPPRSPEPDTVAEEPEAEPEPDVVIEVAPEPATAPSPRKKRRRAAPKKKPAKPRLDADYLPPSRRSG